MEMLVEVKNQYFDPRFVEFASEICREKHFKNYYFEIIFKNINFYFEYNNYSDANEDRNKLLQIFF